MSHREDREMPAYPGWIKEIEKCTEDIKKWMGWK